MSFHAALLSFAWLRFRSSYSKKSRRYRENVLTEGRPETRESGMSIGQEEEPEEDPNVDPFIPQERIFSKYAAMMYTSDNNGKSFHEFKDARYCPSCGEKVLPFHMNRGFLSSLWCKIFWRETNIRKNSLIGLHEGLWIYVLHDWSGRELRAMFPNKMYELSILVNFHARIFIFFLSLIFRMPWWFSWEFLPMKSAGKKSHTCAHSHYFQYPATPAC